MQGKNKLKGGIYAGRRTKSGWKGKEGFDRGSQEENERRKGKVLGGKAQFSKDYYP